MPARLKVAPTPEAIAKPRRPAPDDSGFPRCAGEMSEGQRGREAQTRHSRENANQIETTTPQMVSQPTDIFGDLPDALINALLTRSDEVGKKAKKHVDGQVRAQGSLRKRAIELGLVKQLPDLSSAPAESVVAVDGSVVSKRLASFDFNSAAALAVDGMGSDAPANVPRHDIAVHVTNPLPYGSEVAYALMFCLEYNIASTETNHRKLVLLDGAFSTGLIAISKALISTQNHFGEPYNDFFDRWTSETMQSVREIMTSDRVVALPKRSSANEFRDQTNLFNGHEINTNGRSTASLILESNEYSGPFPFDTRTPRSWPRNIFPDFWKEVRSIFEELQVVYFKPHPWSHAYRIEIPRNLAVNEKQRHLVLDTIKRQCINAAMMEPYPLYVADRFVKSLAKGADAILDSARRDVIAKSDDPNLAHAMLNAYRTELATEEIEE